MKRKTIFQTIRKQTAPPTERFKNKKKAQQADKVGRLNKYKDSGDE